MLLLAKCVTFQPYPDGRNFGAVYFEKTSRLKWCNRDSILCKRNLTRLHAKFYNHVIKFGF